jgi:acetyl esterase
MITGTLDRDYDTISMQRFGHGPFYPTRAIALETARQYAPGPEVSQDIRLNCAAADPEIVPPLYLAAAELDVFSDSSRAMAAKLDLANRPHRLKVYAGMTHLFFGHSRTVDGARQCVQDVAAFLRDYVPVHRDFHSRRNVSSS